MIRKVGLVISCFIILIALVLVSVINSQKEFEEILTGDTTDINKIILDTPENKGKEHSTINEKKIQKLVSYFKQFNYEGFDSTGFMPTRAGIIYLYIEKKVNYIVYYNDEVMVNGKVYEVKDGKIDEVFLLNYYRSLADRKSTHN
ncbi:hypothetical protein [Virgibacillus sp. DJP39]|uniref:hypothetical protein n=1 Tax=Virgibacillus sp. DJP39 TaxID=3409790 RepID=UPI003BB51933